MTANQLPEETLEAAENFCHNPGKKNYGPWCYTTDSGTKWDVCDVPKCDSCKYIVNNLKLLQNF